MLESWGLETKNNIKVEEEYKPPKYDAFKVMMSAFNKRYNPSEDEIKKIPEFLFHNILSNNEIFLQFALFFTCYNVPIDMQYKLIRNLPTPKYIPYPKKSKKNETIEAIAKYYKVSKQTAKEYLQLLPKEKVKEILKISNKL